MRGRLSTWQKCPKCGAKFARSVVASYEVLHCQKCRTIPTRYYLDIFHKGKRHKISRDKRGRLLSSADVANALLGEIRLQEVFDPTRYVRSRLQSFLMETVIDGWLQDARRGDYAVGTIRKKAFLAPLFIVYWRGHDIREIKTRHIEDWKAQLVGKANYRNSFIGQLSSVFRWALRRELIERMPLGFERLHVQAPVKHVMDIETQARVLDAFPSWLQPIMRFMCLTGCRPSMARALQWEDIQWFERKIVFQHNYSGNKFQTRLKNRRILEFPLTEEIEDILRGLGRQLGRHVFINPVTMRPFGVNLMGYRLKSICLKLGVEPIPLKNFTRHSFASNLIDRGAHLSDVADLLGHADVRVTRDSYARVKMSRLEGVLRLRDNGKTTAKRKH